MVEIDLDGQKVSVPEGSMVMHAADAAGVYIPHFCYHKKLSIAANCRMCLVDIEKAPKPMPACATPVVNGMIVRTKSDKALKAQQSVMEFLLINHPLDCPICDQGGECQLQDLAVGYGGGASRYQEEKRVVFHKDVGPLISMEEMSRCIHCTRCVRFGQEVAGIMELGMIHRGEHSEITTVAGDTVDSELSGNMIDICPVGALTSKPFRYSARTWELSRRKSVSPHDSVGANLIVQVKSHKVMRVVPLENPAVNECWISDRDRFAYEALNGDDRLTEPMIKQGGQWKPVDWTTALDYVAGNLQRIKSEHGAAALGFLAAPTSTVEELHLFERLARGLGSDNLDHRLRHADFANLAPAGAEGPSARWLGMPIAELSTLQRVLVIGSFLRKDHPLFAVRLREAARRGAKVHSLHALDDDWLMPTAPGLIAAPSQWATSLAQVLRAVAAAQGVEAPALALGLASGDIPAGATAIAASLLGGERKAVLLGNAAAQHPDAAVLLALADALGQATGARVGYLTEAGNTVGAQLLGLQPATPEGRDAATMMTGSIKAFVLLNLEPGLDHAQPGRLQAALGAAHTVVALSAFRSAVSETADVLLPIAPFTESAGSFVNAEGRVQGFHGVVRPLGQSRPAWKVLRVLGNLLGLPGFDFETSDDVLRAALPRGVPAARLSNAPVADAAGRPLATMTGASGLERLADVPIHWTDAIVRRAASLQLTADARAPMASLPTALWRSLDLAPGDQVRVTGDTGFAVLPARLDPSLAPGVVRIPAGHPLTLAIGGAFGALALERVAAAQPVEA
jgi:NADH-quinone oxidoreductase subunit G